MSIRGDTAIYNALDRYLDTTVGNADEVPLEIKSKVIRQIIRNGNIDSNKFIKAVDFREIVSDIGDIGFAVDTSSDSRVSYDGYVEGDPSNNYLIENRDGTHRRGSKNFIEGMMQSEFDPIFDRNFRESF